jgi:SAM-dependent methyltransferase
MLGPAYRAYERALALRGGHDRGAADGLPIPPADLIVRVAGTPDVDWFLEGGRLGYETVRTHAQPEPASVLDFGCGCGRVTRYWADHRGVVAGSDVSAEAIGWCRRNLPFGRFETNGLAPPLAFEDASFDLVYALSVFTHLTADLQIAWRDELQRVLRPGGRLLLTTHGRSYLPRLDAVERDAFDRGELVVRWANLPGSNLCSAYHPELYLRDSFARGFAFLELDEEGARGNPTQDLVVLKKQ